MVKLAMEETLLEMTQSPIWLAYIFDEAQGRNNKWEYISNPSLGFKHAHSAKVPHTTALQSQISLENARLQRHNIDTRASSAPNAPKWDERLTKRLFVMRSSHVGPFVAKLALIAILLHPSTFRIPFCSIWCQTCPGVPEPSDTQVS